MVGTAGLKEGELRLAATTAPVTIAASTTASAAQTKPFKRGFLDAKPTRSSKQGVSGYCVTGIARHVMLPITLNIPFRQPYLLDLLHYITGSFGSPAQQVGKGNCSM